MVLNNIQKMSIKTKLNGLTPKEHDEIINERKR